MEAVFQATNVSGIFSWVRLSEWRQWWRSLGIGFVFPSPLAGGFWRISFSFYAIACETFLQAEVRRSDFRFEFV